MLIEQPGVMWVWLGLHVLPVVVASFRAWRLRRSALASFLLFAFLSPLFLIAEGATIYFFHSELPVWTFTLALNALAFFHKGRQPREPATAQQ